MSGITPTPRPWFVGPYYKSDIHNAHGRVAEAFIMRGDQGIADAAHIVTCVNAHDDLLAALKVLVEDVRGELIDGTWKDRYALTPHIDAADAAIAKAEGR